MSKNLDLSIMQVIALSLLKTDGRIYCKEITAALQGVAVQQELVGILLYETLPPTQGELIRARLTLEGKAFLQGVRHNLQEMAENLEATAEQLAAAN